MTNSTEPQPKQPLDLDAAIYPIDASPTIPLKSSDAQHRDVGVCFSGGGSRSLSAVMGQLRGLDQQGWLDRVGTLSAVSGGCWASALFTFLPAKIPYDDFLGTGVLPGQLKWDDGDHPESLAYLPPDNMGHVPTRLGFKALYDLFVKLKEEKFDDYHQFWRVAIGQLIFQDYGLYQPDSDHNPTHFYTWSEDYFNRTILPHNPKLSAADFHFARNPWPWLIMNGSMFYPQGVNSLVPVVSTLFQAGIRATFPQAGQQGNPAGGGFVDAFGFGSRFLSRASTKDRVKISQQRPFSLVDMASISSAAFAEAFFHRIGVKDLEPEYHYWPVTGGGSEGEVRQFADAGLLENTGLASLLANTSLEKVVVFVNGSQKVEHDAETWDFTQVPDTIPTLFGFQPIQGFLDDDGYLPYAGDNHPKSPLLKHNQIFPSSRFQELLDGLRAATDDFENSAIFFQQGLKLRENPWFGITSDQQRCVDVLWVINNQVKSWERQITDSAINDRLDLRLIPKSGLWNFPYYGTVTQLGLSAQQVNMLAQLSWWNVTAEQNQDQWKKIFD